MLTINVDLGERSYPIYIDIGLLSQTDLLLPHLASKSVVIVSNETVAPLYLEQLQSTLKASAINTESVILPDGEKYKTLEYFELILSRLLACHASRDTTLIALGGGVIGDMGGFAAACFQRGIPFIQVPTTLLSQVDSSVGGKTAVNHPLGKNMIGAFYQPQAVLIDISTLSTLPEREFSAGMAEVIKYGIMYDVDFFEWLERHAQEILNRDVDALKHIIANCCRIKAEVVNADEKEHGVRALLNLGHTFGHAIEAEQGYGNWLHGEAVGAGMVIAAQLAEQRNWLDSSQTRRISALIKHFQLPVSGPVEMNAEVYIGHMQHDKKVLQGKMRFILPTAIGKACIVNDVSVDELHQLLD